MSKSLLGYVRWFVFDSKILNWSQVNKCILVLVFYLFIRALWISWKGFTLLTPEVQQFVNLETLYFHLNIEIVEFFFTLVVIFSRIFVLYCSLARWSSIGTHRAYLKLASSLMQ